jgi:SAM-dependent methyltransferase
VKRKFAKKIQKIGRIFGVDPLKVPSALINLPWFVRDYREIRRQAAQSQFDFPFAKLRPILHEKCEQSGSVLSDYFIQDLYVARRIFEINPERHVDVGSRIDGFVAHVAAFREIEVLDIRPLDTPIPGVSFRQADLMELDDALVECTGSLSCLHTIEHFGLGRYGDPIDFDGFDKGLSNLAKILRPGGTFHFSTPVGPQRIEFNANRVFSVRFLVDYFSENFDIKRLCYVGGCRTVEGPIPLDSDEIETNFGRQYGVGIFEMVKK